LRININNATSAAVDGHASTQAAVGSGQWAVGSGQRQWQWQWAAAVAVGSWLERLDKGKTKRMMDAEAVQRSVGQAAAQSF
jgi:hypothetical protein